MARNGATAAALAIVSIGLGPMASAQFPLAPEVHRIITTEEFERMVTRALIEPPSEWNASSPALADDPLATKVRRVIEQIMPAHEAYLERLRGLLDGPIRELRGQPVDLMLSGTLVDVMNEERHRWSIEDRGSQSNRLFFDAVLAAFPDAQKPRAEAIVLEWQRRRVASRFSNYAGILAVDLIALLDDARLSPEQREQLAAASISYERNLISGLEQFGRAMRRDRHGRFAALRAREAEYLAAFRADPRDAETVERIRREAWAEVEKRSQVTRAVRALEELQWRTLGAILPRLSPEQRVQLLHQLIPHHMLLITKEADAASLLSRRLARNAAADAAGVGALEPLCAAWLEQEERLVLRVLRVAQALMDASVPGLDSDEAHALRAEQDEIQSERALAARNFMQAAWDRLGRERAGRLGVRIIGPAECDAPVFEVEADERETDAESRAAEPPPPGSIDTGAASMEEPLPFAALVRWVGQRGDESAMMERLRLAHSDYEAAWRQRIAPLAAERTQAKPEFKLDDIDSIAALDAIHESIDRFAAIERALVEEVWTLELVAAEAVTRELASTRNAEKRAAIRLARLWSIVGPVDAPSESVDDWGRARRINAALFAMHDEMPEPVRAVLVATLVAQQDEIERVLRDRARLQVEQARTDDRSRAATFLRYRSDEGLRIEAAADSERRRTNDEMRRMEVRLNAIMRALIEAPSKRARDESARGGNDGASQGKAGAADATEGARDSDAPSAEMVADFRALTARLLLPKLSREREPLEPILSALESMDELQDQERVAILHIAEAHRAMHEAATTGLVWAAMGEFEQSTTLSRTDPRDQDSARGFAIARWLFEREECNARARLELRNSLRREIVGRIRGLAVMGERG